MLIFAQQPTAVPSPPPHDWKMVVLIAVVFIIVVLAGWATSYARRRESEK